MNKTEGFMQKCEYLCFHLCLSMTYLSFAVLDYCTWSQRPVRGGKCYYIQLYLFHCKIYY